jgi:hypothetical protein
MPETRQNRAGVAARTNDLSAAGCPDLISVQPARRNHQVDSPIIR